MEEGVIPRHEDGEDVAEQARLAFVSMTRATQELHLFHARKRSGKTVLRDPYKDNKPDIAPSRFLSLIPEEHVERVFHPA